MSVMTKCRRIIKAQHSFYSRRSAFATHTKHTLENGYNFLETAVYRACLCSLLIFLWRCERDYDKTASIQNEKQQENLSK